MTKKDQEVELLINELGSLYELHIIKFLRRPYIKGLTGQLKKNGMEMGVDSQLTFSRPKKRVQKQARKAPTKQAQRDEDFTQFMRYINKGDSGGNNGTERSTRKNGRGRKRLH